MYRAMTKEGNEEEGWYAEIEGYHFILPHDATVHNQNTEIMGFYEVLPHTIAMGTGQLDKNDDEIYGSIPISGEMSRGGDEALVGKIPMKAEWGQYVCAWLWRFEDMQFELFSKYRPHQIEIIGRQGEQ